MPTPEVDIRSINLDEYLLTCLNKATQKQVNNIPASLLAKVLVKGKWILPDGLTFADRACLLQALEKIFFIQIEGLEQGLDADSLLLAKKALKDKLTLSDGATELHDKQAFVLGNKDLVMGLSFYRLAGAGKIYRLARKLGNKPLGQRNRNYAIWVQACHWFIESMMRYEANLKRLLKIHNITRSGWYCLLFYYFNDTSGRAFINSPLRNAFSAGISNMNNAVILMNKRGFIVRKGKRKLFRYHISPTGQEIVDKIINEFVMNT